MDYKPPTLFFLSLPPLPLSFYGTNKNSGTGKRGWTANPCLTWSRRASHPTGRPFFTDLVSILRGVHVSCQITPQSRAIFRCGGPRVLHEGRQVEAERASVR